jgi:two-component system NarL family sensor kinase
MSGRLLLLSLLTLLASVRGRCQPADPPFAGDGRSLQFSYQESDTNRVREIINLAATLTDADPDRALSLLDTALRESQRAGFETGAGMATYYLGYVYHHKSMYQECIATFRQALLYAERDPRLKSKMPSIYNTMAVQYMYVGDYYQSILCLSRAALMVEAGQGDMSMTNIYNNIPIILRLMDPGSKHEEATWYYMELAENTARKEKNYKGLVSALINKGIHYGRNQQWAQSMIALREALDLARTNNFPGSQVSALNNIATVYLQIDSPDRALSALQEAQAVKGNVFTHHRIRTLHTMGQLHYAVGNYETAEGLLLQAMAQAEKTHFVTVLPEIHHTLSQLYTVTQQYKDALHYYRKYVAGRDSITRKEITANIHHLEVRYRTAQKDKELIRKEFQIAQQRNRLKEKNTWILGIASGALLLATLLIGAHRNNRNRQRLQAEQIRNLEQQREIVGLKAMMKGEEKERARIARELHDGIVGQLSAVKLSFSAVRRQLPEDSVPDFEEALHQLDETTGELRMTAHNLMPEILLQAGLAEAIHIYCGKMSKGAPPVINFHNTGDIPRMEAEFELSVYRIAQELIQNAVKHSGADTVLVQLDCQDGLLGLTVEDDGRGFDYAASTSHSGSGIGLQNLRERVKVMNGRLSVTSVPEQGTSFYLELDTDQHPA